MTPQVVDGEFRGTLVVIEFPTREQAWAWCYSPAYQAILPLRTDNCDGGAFLVARVPLGYRAADFVTKPG